MKKFIAELTGTFALVLFGTGSIILDDTTNGMISNTGIAITFGIIVAAMIYLFGPISGAHINPAVTIGFSLTDRFKNTNVYTYIIAQFIGAILASSLLKIFFGKHKTLGGTFPQGDWKQSFFLEILMSYLLMLVILIFSQKKELSKFTGLATGMIVFFEANFGGPISGASMNPARSFAPALLSTNLNYLWIYIIAPIVGACLASLTWTNSTKNGN